MILCVCMHKCACDCITMSDQDKSIGFVPLKPQSGPCMLTGSAVARCVVTGQSLFLNRNYICVFLNRCTMSPDFFFFFLQTAGVLNTENHGLYTLSSFYQECWSLTEHLLVRAQDFLESVFFLQYEQLQVNYFFLQLLRKSGELMRKKQTHFIV